MSAESELVDSSVWVNHFKKSNAILSTLLISDTVLIHPMIIGELACGTPPSPRQKTLGYLKKLRQSTIATGDEVLDFIEMWQLFGLGCGLVDIHLLVSAIITPGTKLWTLDSSLKKQSKQFSIQYTP